MSADLRTSYLGMELKNPIVAAATPFTGELANVVALEEAGVSMVILPSLFEEQIAHDEMQDAHLFHMGEGHSESLGFFPEMESYNNGCDRYLENLKRIKKAVGIPIMGSINGHTRGGWIRYAKSMEDSGADAIELNVYDVETNDSVSSEDVEKNYLDLISTVKEALSVPLAVKIGPFFSSLVNFVCRMKEAGADGVVLFNRFMEPDIDLKEFKISRHIELSTPSELRLPLRWIGVLKKRVDLNLAATSGIQSALDVVKLVLAGADIVEIGSAFLRHGAEYGRELADGFRGWMEDNDRLSVAQIKGSLCQLNAPEPDQFERANYMRALVAFSNPDI